MLTLCLILFSVATIVQEASIEAIVLLGEADEPQVIVDMLKGWIPSSPPSIHLQTILTAFLERFETAKTVLVTEDSQDE